MDEPEDSVPIYVQMVSCERKEFSDFPAVLATLFPVFIKLKMNHIYIHEIN